MAASTIGHAVAQALEAYQDLIALGEEVEDEWSYVQDLSDAWTTRLDEVVSARGDEEVDTTVVDAIERLAGEAGLIRDPHRAIDWLSTFPQVVLVAMQEPT